ncbi:hypothetical protein Tco_0870678 [Tanacetum coccineum]
MFQDFCYSDTAHLSRSVEVLKLKNFKKDATLKLFKNGMSMSVQKSQVHKMAKLQDGEEYAGLMISKDVLKSQLSNTSYTEKSSTPKVNDHYNIFTRESQENDLNPTTELSAEQAFPDTYSPNPTMILSNINHQSNVKIPVNYLRTTPDARTEGEWGFEHTKAIFNNEIIPFLKSLKDIFKCVEKDPSK